MNKQNQKQNLPSLTLVNITSVVRRFPLEYLALTLDDVIAECMEASPLQICRTIINIEV